MYHSFFLSLNTKPSSSKLISRFPNHKLIFLLSKNLTLLNSITLVIYHINIGALWDSFHQLLQNDIFLVHRCIDHISQVWMVLLPVSTVDLIDFYKYFKSCTQSVKKQWERIHLHAYFSRGNWPTIPSLKYLWISLAVGDTPNLAITKYMTFLALRTPFFFFFLTS